MSEVRCSIDQMASVIMEGLKEYSKVVNEDMKAAVKKVGNDAKKDVQAGAPVKTGAYKKSWSVKTTRESANVMEVVVHSRNRYQLAHLLEFGHAKRNGGRTRAFPHIAPAEQKAVENLEKEIRKSLEKG